MKANKIHEWYNGRAKFSKGGYDKVADYEEKVVNVLLGLLPEEEAWAVLEAPDVMDLLADAAMKRKDPERFARKAIAIANEKWKTNESVRDWNEYEEFPEKEKEWWRTDAFKKFEHDCAEEFYAAGMSHIDIRKIMDDDEFQDDAQWHSDEGYNGQEYARMLLNKWSGVPKHSNDNHFLEEGLLGRFFKAAKEPTIDIEWLVDTIDRVEEMGIDREEAIEVIEKYRDVLIVELYEKRYKPREAAIFIKNIITGDEEIMEAKKINETLRDRAEDKDYSDSTPKLDNDFEQWKKDVTAEIAILLEEDPVGYEKLFLSEIKGDPFEEFDDQVIDMFDQNMDPREAGEIILKIIMREVDRNADKDFRQSRGSEGGMPF